MPYVFRKNLVIYQENIWWLCRQFERGWMVLDQFWVLRGTYALLEGRLRGLPDQSHLDCHGHGMTKKPPNSDGINSSVFPDLFPVMRPYKKRHLNSLLLSNVWVRFWGFASFLERWLLIVEFFACFGLDKVWVNPVKWRMFFKSLFIKIF